ncbi:MAG: acyclic terpene utilization AtuA family protein [Acidimicrobiia bacterium]|nr:acyclic terpene utilization AtuA family protein [Acidimicrobiia bacterium]
MAAPLRVANCSGFYGDRFDAAREMVEGGPIDVLTGDYLAELTMAILWRSRAKDPSRGYASSFYRQMEEVLGRCLDRGIRVVANAGGLNPGGLAERLRDLADDLGLELSVGVVTGDDLMGRLDDVVAAAGGDLPNLDSGRPFAEVADRVLTANAYLGGWGIAAALDAGADVVVTGRVADAALVAGPAAHHHGWAPDDWDALAGAMVAGHVVECGTQCTGGNDPAFASLPGVDHPGFPIAEVAEDGSAVITKHPGTGGAVTGATVTAQLLYEVGGPAYATPDVVARFDTIHLEDLGDDRVRVSGVRGQPAPDTAKLGLVHLGGFRQTMTLLVPPPDVRAKADLVEGQLRDALGSDVRLDTELIEGDPDAATRVGAAARFRVTATSDDASAAGRAFSAAVVELALASYPGFSPTAPPGEATPFTGFWPALAPSSVAVAEVTVDGEPVDVAVPPISPLEAPDAEPGEHLRLDDGRCCATVPLGRVVGARSGDKGADANVGVWAHTDAAFAWLDRFLDVGRLRSLVPEIGDLAVDRHRFPNLRALNFVVRGLLGEGGVAASTRLDPQAKTLGEFLRSREVEVPLDLLEAQ